MFNSMLHTTCSLVCLDVYCMVIYKPKRAGPEFMFFITLMFVIWHVTEIKILLPTTTTL